MYVPTFHPATVVLAQAVSVSVAVGEERSGVDVHLQLRPAVSINGRVVDAAGAAAGPVRLAIIPSGAHIPVDSQMIGRGGSGQASSLGGAVQVTTARDGSFTVDRLWPGSYTLFAASRTPEQASQVSAALLEITLEEDVPDLSIALHSAATVRGRLIGSDRSVPDWSGVKIWLRSLAAAPIAVHPPAGAVEASGAFAVRGVLPGRYWLTLEGLPDGWAVTGASTAGRDAFERPLQIDTDTAPLQIHLTYQPTRVVGRFSDQAGRPVSDYLLVALPEERRRWQWPSRRIQAIRPASNGEFAFTGLPPGAYRLAAVVDAAEEDLHDPAFLEALHAAGVSVTVRRGERTVQDIREGGGRSAGTAGRAPRQNPKRSG
jgi:hypothetical protein